MNKNDIIKAIEDFAPPELAESWDCSGSIVDLKQDKIEKIMVALTITDDVYRQAKAQNCDMIVSHHPLFFVPFKYKDIQMYCAHTNMDNTKGGTTDTIIELLGYAPTENRVIETDISVEEFAAKLKMLSPNLRIVNNHSAKILKKIGFCAGSGSDYIDLVDCDAFVTGDIKYHTAVEADKVLFDIGHFESEIPILQVFKRLIEGEVVIADEKNPFITV